MALDQSLFQLRAAAAEWLSEHSANPNAPAVRAALIETNPPAVLGDKASSIVSTIEAMPKFERQQVFSEILAAFCIYCGGETPCHCQNDE